MPLPDKNVPIKKLSNKDRIYQTLCGWIIDGTLQPGERIFDTEIAAHFEVSRTPVREALQMLADQRLVEIKPNISTGVSLIDETETRQAYSLLATLHCKALEEAFDVLNKKQLELLDIYNTQLRKAIKELDPQHCVESDTKFHKVILQAANNRFLIDCIDKVNVHILRVEYSRFKSRSWEVSSANDHVRIIDALNRGDKASAIYEMKQNWLSFAN